PALPRRGDPGLRSAGLRRPRVPRPAPAARPPGTSTGAAGGLSRTERVRGAFDRFDGTSRAEWNPPGDEPPPTGPPEWPPEPPQSPPPRPDEVPVEDPEELPGDEPEEAPGGDLRHR